MFMFKNYWTVLSDFIAFMQRNWDSFISDDPLFILSKKMALSKKILRELQNNSISLHSLIGQAKKEHNQIFSLLSQSPDDISLIAFLQSIQIHQNAKPDVLNVEKTLHISKYMQNYIKQ